jgi:Cd2+/Zn2+-exporting ATPase
MKTQEKIFTIKGLDCADCAQHAESAVSKIPGVSKAEINFATSKLKVIADNPQFDFSKVISTIEGIGYSVETEVPQITATLKIEGMDCADESEIIEKKLKSQKGIANFEINLMLEQVKISYDPAFLSTQDLMKIIAETGMKASLVTSKEEQQRPWWTQNRQVLLLITSGILTTAGVIIDLMGQALASQIIFGVAIVVGAFYPAKMGILALRTRTINIRLLMVIGAVGAVALGLWEEAALLVVIYSLGDVLEAYSVDKARGAIKALMKLAPKEALIRRNSSEITLPTEEIQVGDTIIVRPGERIPLDGIVVAGRSFVDQSAITGESIPLRKESGDEAFAGTINQKGSLEIEVTKKASDTTLARIIHSVEEAQAKKTSYQRFAEKFGKYYTPAMFALGIFMALVPPLFVGQWESFIYRGLVVLVVSCSCGLALSVPVSIVSATAKGARKGILFKGGSYLEAARELKAIAFDKTGTLTIGRPVVTDIIAENKLSKEETLAIAGAVECRSEHPLAEAIVRRAKEDGISLSKDLEEFETITGMGVKAKINGYNYFVGSRRLLEEKRISVTPIQDEKISKLENEGKTIVLLGDERKLLGVLAVADQIRAEAKDAVQDLKRLGLRVVMLTGDNDRTAKAIASQVGVDEYLAQLLPEDKVEAVKGLKQKFGKVAMVGDGINDAPAMAVSDVGIAMGAAGTDIAIETGDIVLMSDDLSKIPFTLKLSRKTISNVRQNTAASLAIVAFLIPAALIGLLGLLPGLLLNEVSALIVIANALRLLR